MQFGFEDFKTCSDASSGRRLLAEQEFDLCVVNTPLLDEFGNRFAMQAAYIDFCQVILIVAADKLEETRAHVEEAGVLTISKPFTRESIWSVIKLANATFNKISRLKNSNSELKVVIEDIKRVDRAKCCLIEFERMTEEEAHKYIERTAMNRRVSKRVIVDEIITKYARI